MLSRCRYKTISVSGLLILLFLALPGAVLSQANDPASLTAPKPTSPQAGAPAEAQEPAAPAMFVHPNGTRFFIAGQANIIFQAHVPYHSAYEGSNSST